MAVNMAVGVQVPGRPTQNRYRVHLSPLARILSCCSLSLIPTFLSTDPTPSGNNPSADLTPMYFLSALKLPNRRVQPTLLCPITPVMVTR